MTELPEKMKAGLFTGSGKIELSEIPVPKPAEDYVVIQVHTCGICGSDLHSYKGTSLRRNFGKWRELRYPDGHELCGVVVEKGAKVNKDLIGKRVVAECATHCGEGMYCQMGLYNVCLNRQDIPWNGPGGFAEYAHIPANATYEVPRAMSFAEGSMVEPLAASYHAIQRAGLSVNESVLILGAGTIGLLCAAVARVRGLETVVLVVKYEHQAEMARKLGIDKVIKSATDLVSEARGRCVPEGFDVVIDTTGSGETFNTALQSVRKAGRVVLMGGYARHYEVNLGPIVGLELAILGSLCYGISGGKPDFISAIDLIHTKKIDALSLVTHTFRLEEIDKAFATASDKRSGAIKVMIKMRD